MLVKPLIPGIADSDIKQAVSAVVEPVKCLLHLAAALSAISIITVGLTSRLS
jgi:hypothetical protein